MKRRLAFAAGLLAACTLNAATPPAAEMPKVVTTDTGSQLIVDGKPFLMLGGELGNSSAGTAGQADTILPRLAKMHVNTVLMPVAWEQTEPREGQYDFSILDHWIDTARAQNVHLVLLWFGAWKNAFSNYTPAWVKEDTRRFPRAISAEGQQTEILSTLGEATRQCDSRAFAALMQHVRQKDEARRTVLMVQVENEVGFLGRGRDRSPEANNLFREAVPEVLVKNLEAHRDRLSPELARNFHPAGKSWTEAFGTAADEVFMAWHYATYMQAVTAAGKQQYALPMYANAQLPAPAERAGEYPSGAPHPYYMQVYRAGAPAIDFYSPDIYWPDFEYWVGRYVQAGNPVFVPEARLDAGPFNALYAFGAARAIGFSAFGIDSLAVPADESGDAPASMMETYAALGSLRDLLPSAEAAGQTQGLVLHASSPRPTQTVALGGYLFEATLARSWPAKSLLTQDGAMLLLQTAPGEVYVVGSGLTVTFNRDPDVDGKRAGIASIEEVSRTNGVWQTEKRLNGDQSNQGRQLSMSAHRVAIYRVRLYTY